MIPVLNIFTRQKTEVPELIEVRKKSFDFIISVPHSGLLFPLKFSEYFSGMPLIEVDMFSELVYDFPEGARIISRMPPYLVDMNRAKNGSEDAPLHLTNDPFHYITVGSKRLITHEYSEEHLKELEGYYDFYHSQLRRLIEEMKARNGYALVLDGHSMTSKGIGRAPDLGKNRADFNIGTLGMTTADKNIIGAFAASLGRTGTVEHDRPYAGGFITRMHADPKNNIHVIQLEVNMATYLDEENYKVNENVKRINAAVRKAMHATSIRAR